MQGENRCSVTVMGQEVGIDCDESRSALMRPLLSDNELARRGNGVMIWVWEVEQFKERKSRKDAGGSKISSTER